MGATSFAWGRNIALPNASDTKSWRTGKAEESVRDFGWGWPFATGRVAGACPQVFKFFSFFLINNVAWLRVAELSHRAVSNHSSFHVVFGCMPCDAWPGPINGSTGQEPKLTVLLSECEARSRSLRLGASRPLSHPPLGLPALPLAVSFRHVPRFSLPSLW